MRQVCFDFLGIGVIIGGGRANLREAQVAVLRGGLIPGGDAHHSHARTCNLGPSDLSRASHSAIIAGPGHNESDNE